MIFLPGFITGKAASVKRLFRFESVLLIDLLNLINLINLLNCVFLIILIIAYSLID